MKYHFRISRRPDGKFTVHCVESYRGRIEDLAANPEGHGFEFIAVPIEPGTAFALSLRRVRTRYCLFQSDIAKHLGIQQSAYQRLEDPERANPTLQTIQRLLDIFPEFDIAECFDRKRPEL